MDQKAFYKLTYGVFMLATKSCERANGCITNTCIQVASDPTRVAVAVNNGNFTCDLIKESGMFTATLLDQTCTFETIKHFGFQSGRDVDKFAAMQCPLDANGIPYLGWQACAVISCKVVSSQDLGTHTLFIGEVIDAKVLSDNAPLTYADYQDHVKPKAPAKTPEKKIVGWKCTICGYIYEGAELPTDFSCPLCGHGPDDFEPIYES
ncbi:MAG: flavin reductase [Acetatifactor sp.]|nr:flavin reductase [Acetatifactor sp.]